MASAGGAFWLDVVRYADSSGFEYDRDIPNAWRYRDYVIKAFNEDKPFNQFIVEQIAGDELDNPTHDSLTATTFYRIGPRVRFREKQNPSNRYDYMDDMIRTTFQGFMGLSVNCARCHDHKFDPITRMDYYRLDGDDVGLRRLRSAARAQGAGGAVRKDQVGSDEGDRAAARRDRPHRKALQRSGLEAQTGRSAEKVSGRYPRRRPNAS